MIKVTRPENLRGSEDRQFEKAITHIEEYLSRAQAGLGAYHIWLQMGEYSEAVQRRIEQTYRDAGWVGVKCGAECEEAVSLVLREPDKEAS